MHDPSPRAPDRLPASDILVSLEDAAARLVRAAGELICASMREPPSVSFKASPAGLAANSNPVSRTDRLVESFIRARLRTDFPEHAIIGEEEPPAGAHAADFTWVIDPIDGTTNYINGVPLFASSIGVLYRGRPVAGATWCAATHALRPGVYHARAGGALHFDGRLHDRRAIGSWRGLASEPGRAPTYGALWDTRVLGSATLEFAWVAAGLLRIAHLSRPALWDAAAGIVLLNAAGCRTVVLGRATAETLLYFDARAEDALRTLAAWSEPLLIGDDEALQRALQQRSAG
jgi:myo-inositol-1(or 4)-monophosphatase